MGPDHLHDHQAAVSGWSGAHKLIPPGSSQPQRADSPLGAALYVAAVSNDFSAEIMGLQVVEHGADARVVTVTGEVDSLTAPELATFLTAQLTAVRLVAVDLDGVEFLGSAGLAVLFEANELAIQQDRNLRLVCHSRIVNRAMDATELRQHFSFADTVEEAVKDLP